MGPDRSAQGCCRVRGKALPSSDKFRCATEADGAQGAGEAVPDCAGLTGTWDLRNRGRETVF